jgi:hypothetical protein
MNSSHETIDPAAVFACAVSLHEACETHANESGLNLSECFNGIDQCWREMMRIGTLFESWACENVVFEALTDVWPYQLRDHFGAACLQRVPVEHLAGFEAQDCPRVALAMRLPIWYREGSRLPLGLTVPNPVSGSAFVQWRIQTVRWHEEDEDWAPLEAEDDPDDPDFETPVLALFGVGAAGHSELVRTFATYAEARSMALKLAPGVGFPELPRVGGERAHLEPET